MRGTKKTTSGKPGKRGELPKQVATRERETIYVLEKKTAIEIESRNTVSVKRKRLDRHLPWVAVY